MAGWLWMTAGIVQLAAIILYYTIGIGTGFWVLEVFVILTFALTVLQIAARGDARRRHRL